MTARRIGAVAAAIGAAGILMGPGMAQAAEIKVLSSNAIKEAYLELVPAFEKASEHKVATTWAGTQGIMKRMQAGETYDLIIMSSTGIDTLTKEGKIVGGSRVDLVKSGIGVAVRAGAPKPDIGSTEALKRALLAAKSVGYSTGPSGVYIAGLFQRLGIADALKPKIKIAESGTPVGAMIARRSRDRLPAGQRAPPRRGHRLCRTAAGGHPARHRVLGGHPHRRKATRRGEGAGEIHHRARGRADHQKEGPGARLTLALDASATPRRSSGRAPAPPDRRYWRIRGIRSAGHRESAGSSRADRSPCGRSSAA